MKKLLISVLVSLVAIGMLATGVVFAQVATPTPTPAQTSQLAQTPVAPGRGGGMMGKHGDGPLRTYFEQALAQKLGLTDAQLQEKLTAGKTPGQIVQETGVAAADVPALLQEVHKTAIANAVTAGVITQAQADDMLLHNDGGMMGKHGNSPIRTYLDQALAQKLGLTDAQLQEKLTAGKTPDQIVQETGVAAADVPALLQEVHKTAIANAVTAGVITQAQADEMLLHNDGGMMGKHGNSPIRTYLDQALAQKLGLTDAQLQEKLTAGKTPDQIVQETGVAAADVPALLQEVHKTAIANAVTAGVITQAQADDMLQHLQDHPAGMPGMGGGHGRGGRGGQNP